MTPYPMSVTTNESLSADLKASLLKTQLEALDICHHTEAEHTARLVVALHDPAARDAALWKGAEAAFTWLHPDAEDEPLRRRPLKDRIYYSILAAQCWAWIRLALEGAWSPQELQQAYADYQNHRQELAARRRLRVVPSLDDAS